ncbi:MAG: hypothetical protein H7224_10770 [Polaromonas sp.]|nr:hypothetical protein [Polaromonas sp.]
MHTKLHLQQLFVTSLVLLLSGCSIGVDPQTTRRSVQLNDVPAQTSRSGELQHRVTAMDAAAFGGPRSGLNLKLSYQLTLVPHKT